MKSQLAILSIATVSLTTLALADRPGGDRPHHGPPPEAVDACASKGSGDACSFDAPDGRTIDGSCDAPPDGNGALACRPSRPPEPPPEAVDACADHARGASCSFQHGDRTIRGTCDAPPDAATLACRPE